MVVTAKQAITQELQALRRESGPLVPAKMIYAPAVTKGLGGDNPTVALERLLQLADEHGTDLDIDAALFVMGRGTSARSVLDKHTEWAGQHFVDERTARRRADAGIRKLVALIMGPAPWLQPRVTQELWQDRARVLMRFHLRLPPKIAMQRFEVLLDGDDQDIQLERLDRTEAPRTYRSTIEGVMGAEAETTTVRVRWRGEKAPTYRLIVRAGIRANVETVSSRWELLTRIERVEPSSLTK